MFLGGVTIARIGRRRHEQILNWETPVTLLKIGIVVVQVYVHAVVVLDHYT